MEMYRYCTNVKTLNQGYNHSHGELKQDTYTITHTHTHLTTSILFYALLFEFDTQ